MLSFLRTSMMFAVLLAPAPGEGGGGGGGGGEQEPPKPPTMDDVNKAINAALGSHGKRIEAKLTETLGGLSKSIEDKLAAFGTKTPENDNEPTAKGKQVDPELVTLKQQLAQQKKEFEAEKQRRVDAETKQRTEKARGLLQNALTKHARPEVVGTLLKAMQNDVQFDEQTGEPMFPLPDGSGTSTIDAAIESWAKSNDAKPFLPAPNQGGSGAQRNTGNRDAQGYKNKPQAQWTEQDRADAFAESVRRNSENAL